MTARCRRPALLVAAAFAAVLGGRSAAEPAPRAQAAAAEASPASAAGGATPLRQRFEAQGSDAFAVRSWQPPAPPAPKPPPQAPALPFRFLGKALLEDGVVAFLGHGQRVHLLRAGDRVADYRVEAVSATGITLVYLPLDETQHISFGSDH